MTDDDNVLRRLAEAALRQPLPWDMEQCVCLHMEDGSRTGDCFYCVQVARSRVRQAEDLATFHRRGTPDVVIGLLTRLADAGRERDAALARAETAERERGEAITEYDEYRQVIAKSLDRDRRQWRDRAEKAEAALAEIHRATGRGDHGPGGNAACVLDAVLSCRADCAEAEAALARARTDVTSPILHMLSDEQRERLGLDPVVEGSHERETSQLVIRLCDALVDTETALRELVRRVPPTIDADGTERCRACGSRWRAGIRAESHASGCALDAARALLATRR